MDVKWLEAANKSIQKLAKQLVIAHRWSAAWKAKATQMRYRWLQEQGRGDSFRKMFTEQRQRAEAAEKRVAELENCLNAINDWLDSDDWNADDEPPWFAFMWNLLHPQQIV